MKHMFKIQMAIAGAILVIGVAKAFSAPVPPAPEPNETDVPFPYDPNQCLSSPMDWLVCGPGESITYSLKVVSRYGTKVAVTTSVPSMTVGQGPRTFDAHHNVWVQVFTLLWTPLTSDEGVNYINLIAIDRAGRRCERTLIALVADDPPQIYPYDAPIVTSDVRWSQEVIQRARKLGRYPAAGPGVNRSTRVHRWN